MNSCISKSLLGSQVGNCFEINKTEMIYMLSVCSQVAVRDHCYQKQFIFRRKLRIVFIKFSHFQKKTAMTDLYTGVHLQRRSACST